MKESHPHRQPGYMVPGDTLSYHWAGGVKTYYATASSWFCKKCLKAWADWNPNTVELVCRPPCWNCGCHIDEHAEDGHCLFAPSNYAPVP